MSIVKIKGFNHLLSKLKGDEITPVLLHGSHRVFKGVMIKIDKIILFFWGGGNASNIESLNKNYNIRLSKEQKEFVWQQLAEYGAFSIFTSGYGYRQMLGCQSVVLLPCDIDSKLQKCIRENRKQFEPIFKQYTSQDNPTVYLSYMLCDGNATYMTWVLKQQLKNGISWHILQRILKFVAIYPQLISKLIKGNIIPYDGKCGMAMLTAEIHQLQCQKRVDAVLNQFNTNQKKLLKALPKDKTIISSFSKFDQLSKTKQRNFIRKVSTMDDVNEILNQLSFVVSNHFNWDKKSILDYLNNVEDLDYEIVVEKDNILLLNVKDYETIKRVGKTTNWCISKNKSYWRNYMAHPNRKQYVLIDLSQKEDSENSIVGFTVEDNIGIVAAHSFTNKDILKGGLDNTTNLAFTSIFNRVEASNIYNILKSHSIDSTILFESSNTIPWEEEAVINEISLLTEDSFDIVETINQNKGLLLRIYNDSWKGILDVKQQRRRRVAKWQSYLVYLNFNLPQSDSHRILYVPIDKNLNTNEEYAATNNMYDSYGNQTSINFEKFIKSNNIDFDIICRTDTLANNLLSICASDDKDAFISFIQEHHANIPQIMQNIGASKTIFNFIDRSINSYYSTDIIDILYDYQLSISDFTNEVYTSEFYSVLMSRILRNLDREWNKNKKINKFTSEDIENLKQHPININPIDEIHRSIKEVGLFYLYLFQKVLECEKPQGICSAIRYLIGGNIGDGTLSSLLLKEMLDLLGPNDMETTVFKALIMRLVEADETAHYKYGYLRERLSTFSQWNSGLIKTIKSNIKSTSSYWEVLEKMQVKV